MKMLKISFYSIVDWQSICIPSEEIGVCYSLSHTHTPLLNMRTDKIHSISEMFLKFELFCSSLEEYRSIQKKEGKPSTRTLFLFSFKRA